MSKSSIALITTGVILGIIILWWQLIPLIFQKPVEVTWTEEAQEYSTDWAVKVFYAVGAHDPVSVAAEARANAEEVANQTDKIVHLIDLRVGMALTWWEISQPGSIFPGRYSWLPGFERTTVWERLTEGERIAGVVLQVDWDFEAVNYYYNPGDPYFGVPDQPDVAIEVLRLASDGNETEFRNMVANVTVKAEELAADDGVVNLIDLRTAMATILHQQYPDRYPKMDDAWTKLEELEQQLGYTPPP